MDVFLSSCETCSIAAGYRVSRLGKPAFSPEKKNAIYLPISVIDYGLPGTNCGIEKYAMTAGKLRANRLICWWHELRTLLYLPSTGDLLMYLSTQYCVYIRCHNAGLGIGCNCVNSAQDPSYLWKTTLLGGTETSQSQ